MNDWLLPLKTLQFTNICNFAKFNVKFCKSWLVQVNLDSSFFSWIFFSWIFFFSWILSNGRDSSSCSCLLNLAQLKKELLWVKILSWYVLEWKGWLWINWLNFFGCPCYVRCLFNKILSSFFSFDFWYLDEFSLRFSM